MGHIPPHIPWTRTRLVATLSFVLLLKSSRQNLSKKHEQELPNSFSNLLTASGPSRPAFSIIAGSSLKNSSAERRGGEVELPFPEKEKHSRLQMDSWIEPRSSTS